MFPSAWIERRMTDSMMRILGQLPLRAIDRGLGLCAVDEQTVVMLALWSVLLWERKLGLAAIEEAGINRFDLVRGLDQLLQEKASELPETYDKQQAGLLDKQQAIVVLSHQSIIAAGWTSHPDGTRDFEDLLEPVLQQAAREAKDLGHDYIGSEHLVLAILKLAVPPLQTLLQKHAVAYEPVRNAVVRLLQP
jgi:ATP-dependent Clp protease ATP-binding subunit ClpA